MRLSVGRRNLTVELGPILFVAAGLLWAAWHFFGVRAHEFVEASDLFLIEPLFYAGLVFGALVIVRSVRVTEITSAEEPADPEQQFLHPKRLAFVAALPLYAIALNLFGFLLPSLVMVVLLALALGVRDWRQHAFLVAIAAALIWLGFAELLGVPLKLFP